MRRTIDFAHVIKELQQEGVSFNKMAEETGRTKMTFSFILNGQTKDPAWSTGDYLLRKHAQVFHTATLP
jgi:hypothetical protein